MAKEVELKLEVSPQAADALEGSALLKGAPVTRDQRSLYFDTPDGRLAQAGLSLRIRRSGEDRIQTVKADGASAAGLFSRSEWERPVADDRPVLDDDTPIPALLGKAVLDVAPAFEVHIERRIWNLRAGGARIELALDRGEVVAGDRRSPICEVELELKGGDAAALFAFARRLDAVAPVRLGVLAKAERGYRLMGPVVTAARAEPPSLRPEMTAAQAFQQIVQGCVRQFRLNEARLAEARDANALHQARVALRRLSSAFSIFKEMLGDEEGVRLREALRWLAAQFADARNLDVLLQSRRAGRLRDRLTLERQAAYARVEEALASAQVRALMLDLTQWTATGGWLRVAEAGAARDQSVHAFAPAALDRLRRKVKQGGVALAKTDDAARHALRKDAKKLRYGAEFFGSLFDGKQETRRCKDFIVAVEAVQDSLGALNDFVTAPGLLDRLGVAEERDAARLPTDGEKVALLKKAQAAHDKLLDAKPFWR